MEDSYQFVGSFICHIIRAFPLRAQRQKSNLITPPNVWHKNQDKIKNVELYTHFRNCAPPLSGHDRAQRQQSNLITPPNVWHKNQDRIKNVELYTDLRNCALPPQAGLKDNI